MNYTIIDARDGKLLAVSNEIGQITILDTHYTFREPGRINNINRRSYRYN
jgi:hypothetical protein